MLVVSIVIRSWHRCDSSAMRHWRSASFNWKRLRTTCATTLVNASGIFASAAPFRESKQLGHSVAVAEKFYLGVVRGIDPNTNALVAGDEARIRQAFMNMKTIAESEGASLADAVRLVVYVTDMGRLRPLVNKVQEEL